MATPVPSSHGRGVTPMPDILLHLLIVLIIVGIVVYIISLMPMEARIKQIVYAIFGLLVLIWLLNLLFGLPWPASRRLP